MWANCVVLICIKITGQVTKGTTLQASWRHARARRGLSYLLLLLIAYGATVEAAHSHGHVTAARPGYDTLSDAGGSPSSDDGHSRNRECSMCQFQQQLFGGLVHAPLFARTHSSEHALVSPVTVFHSSALTTPSSGRAPPLV
jgi:hypothetical protein